MITRVSSVIRPGSDLIFDHPYNDYALAIGGMLDRPRVHRTAGSDWASPGRAPQAGRQLAGDQTLVKGVLVVVTLRANGL